MLVAIMRFLEGAGGARLTPGMVLDASDWRNADALIGSGYLRLADAEEVEAYRASERVKDKDKEKEAAHA